MSELVKEFWVVSHYDTCLHGCNIGWAGWLKSECKCPIGKPFIEKESLIKRHLFESYDIPYNPNGMPREKVLEILNGWNGNGARAGVEGYSYGQSNAETGKVDKITVQYPSRWVYFLDPPKWLTDANDESHLKFNVKYEANQAREAEDFKNYGLSMEWIYHEELEDFIVPLEICSYAPHYVDEIPKDAETKCKYDWGDRIWTCSECKNTFVLVNNWKEWKRN